MPFVMNSFVVFFPLTPVGSPHIFFSPLAHQKCTYFWLKKVNFYITLTWLQCQDPTDSQLSDRTT